MPAKKLPNEPAKTAGPAGRAAPPSDLNQLTAAEATLATLRRELARAAWRQWRLPLPPGISGRHLLKVRAVDGRGDLQTARQAPPHPSGATGYDQVDVVSS